MMASKKMMVTRLLDLSMDAVYASLELYSIKCNPWAVGPLDSLAGELVEMLMERAYNVTPAWTSVWYIFLTPKITRAFLPWDSKIWKIARKKCQNLKEVYIFTKRVTFKVAMLDLLPSNIVTLDFHGNLFYRGRSLPYNYSRNWLIEAESWLRSLKIERELKPSLDDRGLSEIHLGDAQLTSDELIVILNRFPNLKLLRHYQMTKALYTMHSRVWMDDPSSALTKYRLCNIDADFSHVVRCRMEPTAILPGNALHLAVSLCPNASHVRIRYDCSTPHYIVAPLTELKNIEELSAVCVTSGERTLLEFTDFTPILEKFGPTSLRSLELKVMEEVDPHVIVKNCSQLEKLTLSGCGFVAPPTCQRFGCANQSLSLRKLKLLFYADGDDFSWDHSLPQCFWKNALSSSIRHKSNLEGIFLESPRITEEVFKLVFNANAHFPSLAVLSLCRSPEITVDHLQDVAKSMPNLQNLVLSSCENVTVRFGVKIKRLFPGVDLKIT